MHCPVQLLFGDQGRVERVLLHYQPVGFAELDVSETDPPTEEQPVIVKWDGDDIVSVETLQGGGVEWIERFDVSLMGAHRHGDMFDSMTPGALLN